ncbi:MAG: amidohydrolase [Sulfobacillus acidophilus]|uniref:Amidohydrolase n=1 Tax=Sulfobacillus acidophilus TaxID=53633 RepID=A0A2T2WJG1_9FIRM|nr:MAG: amidohydrolase [Sulfobacillus acidophilus]
MNDLPLASYHPKSMLRAPAHKVLRPRFPVVDMHNHSEWQGSWQVTNLDQLVAEMDKAGVVARVDLDGGNGDRLLRHLDFFRSRYPERFVVFASCDWAQHLPYDNFGERMAAELARSVKAGAEGLKVWKELGLTLRDNQGRVIAVDDERLVPLFETAADLNVPILIHFADPIAFFQPLDNHNERYEELMEHPDWHFYGDQFPPFDALQQQFARLLTRHPRTTFIGAHVASLAEDLRGTGQLLEGHPNLYVDIAARLAELGRQPYTAADFLTQYADRVVFGLDSWPADADEYRVYYRFLETRDEYFPYWADEDSPVGESGRWQIYGVGLEDDVLQKIYYANTVNIIPRLKAAVEAAQG